MSGLRLQIHLRRTGQGLHVETTVPNGITVVCGPSGSGKTTLLRCIAGLEPNVTGVIDVAGASWLEPTRSVPPHRRGIGFCFQDSRILPHLSVRANLQYGLWFDWFKPANRSPVLGLDEIVERLALGALLHRRGTRLSGGEARRVALGRALLSARTLLLLDEPFVGLEHDMRCAARSLIADFQARSGMPVLAVTHQPRHILGLAEQILLMDEGHCQACGPLSHLLRTSQCFPAAMRIGLPNVLSTRVRWQDPRHRETLCQVIANEDGGPRLRHPIFRATYNGEEEGMLVKFALAPEDVVLRRAHTPSTAENSLAGRVAWIGTFDSKTQYLIDGGVRLLVQREGAEAASLDMRPGDTVWCCFRRDQLERLAS